MPGRLIPHASASHRVACIGLYRALLKQTSLLQGRTHRDQNGALSNVVRYRFHRDRKLVSPTQIANGLNAGYAMLDLVYACNNKDGDALMMLVELVESTTIKAEAVAAWRSTLAKAKNLRNPGVLAKIEHIKAVGDKTKQSRHPDSKPILERPLPLSEIRGGTRRVPNLVVAHGVPFLRYSKPQPVSLSRVIRQKVMRNEKNWTHRGILEEQIVMAEFEDEWDRILRREHGIVDNGAADASSESAEPSWTEEFRNTDGLIFSAIHARDKQSAEMGEKMWEIVKKEKELKRQEKTARRAARKVMRAAEEEMNVSAPSGSECADEESHHTSASMSS